EDTKKLYIQLGGHDVNWYLRQIIQEACSSKSKRAPNHWNVYLSATLTELNKALPEGQPHYKSNNMLPSVKEKWDAMSHDERIVLTDLLLKKLEEQHVMRVLSVQNVSINAFHDVRSNLTSIQDQIEALHVRTGTEVLMVTIRSSNDHFNWLHVFFMSNCLSDFFAVVLNMQLADIAMQMESYCLSSIQGLINNSHDQMMELKLHVTKLINDQFHKSLYYTNFDKKITEKYGVVTEGWPLTKFCSPSDVRSRSEIEILCRAWESEETQFHKLSHKEYEAWSDAQFQAALD
ncbi:hypothetical protein BKA93DRAFT_717635, partial [Sparassis latifolia]